MNVTREPRFGVFLCPKIIYKDMIKVFEEFEYSIADAMRMDSILEFLDDIKDDRLKKLKKIVIFICIYYTFYKNSRQLVYPCNDLKHILF